MRRRDARAVPDCRPGNAARPHRLARRRRIRCRRQCGARSGELRSGGNELDHSRRLRTTRSDACARPPGLATEWHRRVRFMSTYRLDALFNPRSVALVGVSPHEGSLGRAILTNVRAAGFAGHIHIVSPNHAEIDGIPAVKTFDDLPETPDLAVLTTPPAVVPEIVTAAGRKGVAGAVIITAGLGHGAGSLAEAARRAARPHGLRLIGPNCLGIVAPFAKLNASFAA